MTIKKFLANFVNEVNISFSFNQSSRFSDPFKTGKAKKCLCFNIS
jgi:hypothetical protein